MLYAVTTRRDGVDEPTVTLNATNTMIAISDPSADRVLVKPVDLTVQYGKTAYETYTLGETDALLWSELSTARKNRWIAVGLACGDLRTQENG